MASSSTSRRDGADGNRETAALRRPIDHARALVDAGRSGVAPPPDAVAWAAGGLELHLRHGVGLPRALGLVRYGGGGGHAGAERRRERDTLLQEVHRRHFADLGPTAAAAAIGLALQRQARAHGRTEDDLSRALEVLLGFEPPVPASARQVRKLLALNTSF